jgi:hypothetical protein
VFEANLARQRAEETKASHISLCGCLDKEEASTHAEVDRTHAQLVDAYRQLGALTAPFDASGKEVGLRFLGWLQEELGVLATIVMGLKSFALLITCEGVVNALSRKGCRHFEVFDQSDEDFKREIFQVEDPVMKRSAGALYDRMWGPHGSDTVRERSNWAMEQVWTCFVIVHMGIYIYFYMWFLLNEYAISVDDA